MSSRPLKRSKKTHYHDRITLEDDIEVVHSRSSRLTSRNIASETARSPQKGRTTWAVGSSWAPEDDQELALDESGDWFDEEMQAEVFDSGPSCVDGPPKKKYKRSGLLRLLHMISLTSKVSTYDLYRALERLTDNVIIQEQRARYRPLLRIGLQWRHLKLLKRGARGHDEAGIAATKDGELAVMCPSCPHPGINLPDDWADAPEDQRFLYCLLVCLDANFRLKNQLVSNYSSDPGLGTGWAYMVCREPYERHIVSQMDDDDISTCVGFLALVMALTRFSRGLRYTGVGGAFCGRGEMILPNGIGNLQKGERYVNMDYIFASSVRTSKPHVVTRPLIPKFHEPAHAEKDHEQFSFNLAVGVGNSDGEVPERVWAGHNGLGGSTKTSGPGSRHDILDDHFGFWNWQKYCSMGSTLMRRYKAAVAERNRQVEAHRGFTESLPIPMVANWEKISAAWDADRFPKSAPNPFSIEGAGLSEADVRQELAAEDKARALRVPALHSTGPSTWLAMGLSLEDSQRRLRMRAKVQSESTTELQAGSLKEQRAALAKNIKNWEPLCAIYMPGLLQYQADVGVGGPTAWDADPNPEDMDLFLPSRLPANRRAVACIEGLSEMEVQLRTAQCVDALASLRRTLRLKTRMIQFKNANIRGQREGTRSRALIDRVHQRALTSVEKYRAARAALLAISGPGSWETTLQPLLNGDVRSYVDPEGRSNGPGRRGIWEDGRQPKGAEDADEVEMEALPSERSRRDGTGQTKNTVSWIWRVGSANAGASSEGDDEILRSEWSRSRARVQRCKEEVSLL
ncbi:hypothetical protein BJ912DRAFT_850355, partial [Pholiota molesta]